MIAISLLGAGCQAYEPGVGSHAPRTPRLIAGIVLRTDIKVRLPEYGNEDLWVRVGRGSMLVGDTDNNERIASQLRKLLRNHAGLKASSERAKPYLHFIVERLDERQMPLDLALLPVIESAYNPMATSPRNAAGLWQFMARTGGEFKLFQTATYDGRRDLLASTQAAIDYLTRLHKQFDGDWLLALAAYNAGEGTVARAIEANRRRGLAADYWHLSLPLETQDYVPRLLALSMLVQNPQAYGIRLGPVANSPYFEVVRFDGPVDIVELAARSGIDSRHLLSLNAAYLHGTTASGVTSLLVPRNSLPPGVTSGIRIEKGSYADANSSMDAAIDTLEFSVPQKQSNEMRLKSNLSSASALSRSARRYVAPDTPAPVGVIIYPSRVSH